MNIIYLKIFNLNYLSNIGEAWRSIVAEVVVDSVSVEQRGNFGFVRVRELRRGRCRQ